MISQNTDAWIQAVARENAQTVMKEVRCQHTDERPFCGDPKCPCHEVVTDEIQNAIYHRLIGEPLLSGKITAAEANRIFFDEQV